MKPGRKQLGLALGGGGLLGVSHIGKVPAALARYLGAEVVVAVSLASQGPAPELESLVQVI